MNKRSAASLATGSSPRDRTWIARTLRVLSTGLVGPLCFGVTGCAQTRALTAADDIRLEVIYPPHSTQLLVSAAVVDNRLVLGGSVVRSRGKTVHGRIHAEIVDPTGLLLDQRSVPLAVIGPRAQTRRVFSWSYLCMPPAGSRITVSYRGARH